jgi:hypothetical protein
MRLRIRFVLRGPKLLFGAVRMVVAVWAVAAIKWRAVIRDNLEIRFVGLLIREIIL